MPGLPDRPYDARPDVTAPPPVPFTARGGPEPEGVRLVVASGTVASGGDFGDGAGVAAGLSRAWTVARGLSVSGGALLAYGRYVTDPQGSATATVFDALEEDPDETVDVPSRSVLTMVAVEVPVDVTVDVVRTARGRLRASVGLTSALYVGQTFEDEGRRYSAEYVAVPQTSETVFVVSSEPYAERETAPAGRLDLGRQLNLGLGVVGAGADGPGLDLYARLPLGGLTSRDLPLTTVGVRLRVPLP